MAKKDTLKIVGWAGFLPMRFKSHNIISMGKRVAHPTLKFSTVFCLLYSVFFFLLISSKEDFRE